MPPPTTLPGLREYTAKRFGITGLEIVEVDPCSARITTPHRDDEESERRDFWIWLFGGLYGSLHVVGPASCTFVIRRRGAELPPTWGDRMRRFFQQPVPTYYRPDIVQLVALEDISVLDRHRAGLRNGGVSFTVTESEARYLQTLGIKTQKIEDLGRYRVILGSLWMQSITLSLAQILFFWP